MRSIINATLALAAVTTGACMQDDLDRSVISDEIGASSQVGTPTPATPPTACTLYCSGTSVDENDDIIFHEYRWDDFGVCGTGKRCTPGPAGCSVCTGHTPANPNSCAGTCQ